MRLNNISSNVNKFTEPKFLALFLSSYIYVAKNIVMNNILKYENKKSINLVKK